MRLLLAGFLVAHAMIHISYLAPAPPRTAGGPDWPFELTRSWLVTGLRMDPGAVRALGIALVAGTTTLLVAAGLATVGWLIPSGWWPGLVVSGAGLSILTLGVFFHPWLVLGIAIDATLLGAVLVAGWQPIGAGG